MRSIFITGGARSGKSVFALTCAQKLSGKKAFVATAQALDPEMQERIEMHKQQRGSAWDTYEEPLNVRALVEDLKHRYDVVVIDCLTLWLSNVMHAGMDVLQEIDRFAGVTIDNERAGSGRGNQRAGARRGNPSGYPMTASTGGYPFASAPTVFIISNEVGMGIVPENELARRFRDYQGMLNQHVARSADEVYLMVSGIPLKLK